MALLKLPVRSDLKAYEFQVDLDNAAFTLKYRFNERLGRWTMDIATNVGADILTGLPLLTDVPLTDQFRFEELPPGRFILVDKTGENKNAGAEDLGNDVLMFYEEAS